LLDTEVSTRRLRWLCVPVGLIAAWHLLGVVRHERRSRDVFHVPYRGLGWLPDLSPAVFTVVMVTGLAAGVLMAAGAWRRVTTKVTFAVVAYHLALSATNFHHNRAYLVIVLFCLAATPLDRPSAPAWTLWLLRIECSVVYAASGVSKLVDPDWAGGTVTWLRVVHQEAQVRASVLPGWVADVLVDRGAHRLIAPAIVATELAIAASPWFRRTRPWALALAVAFHVSIEVSSRVETFSYLAVAVIVLIWIETPHLTRGEHVFDTRANGVQQPVVDVERAGTHPLRPEGPRRARPGQPVVERRWRQPGVGA